MKIFAILFIIFVSATTAIAESTRIGVLAYDGKQQALRRWQPTADYLSRHIPSHQFQVVPLIHDEFEHAINKGELDFILTNPGHYVRLQVSFGATPIATYISKYQNQVLTQFSSVIFSRSDSNIKSLEDLSGRNLAAVSEQAFGGFQLAQQALLQHNIHALNDINVQWLGFPHADVVKAVLAGKADAGTVRSGILERMATQGYLDLSQIHVLAQKDSASFPLLHSVDLYPEWPFAKLPLTDEKLAKHVAVALYQMTQNDIAALQSNGAGWTIPLDYTSVQNVFRSLHIAPYAPAPLDPSKFIDAYLHWIVIIGLFFLILFLTLMRFIISNKQLQFTQLALQKHQIQVDENTILRADELQQTNKILQQEIAAHIKAEQTINEGCDTLQALHGILIRTDLDRQQRLHSIAELVRHHLGTEIALFSSHQGDKYTICASSPANTVQSIPLSQPLSKQAIRDNQILIQDDEVWHVYIACPVYIAGELCCLFEFATSHQYQIENGHEKDGLSSELGLRIMHLISQWVGNEIMLLEKEKLFISRHQDIKKRFASVTTREHEVLSLLTKGESSKIMARTLNISTKTIELHRANLLRKTHSKSSTELVQLAVLSGILD